MRSVYQDKEFADYWDQVGHDSSGYKKWVVNPVMFKAAGPLKNKIVLELGCGNGVVSADLFSRGAKKVVCMDISQANLDNAKKRFHGKNAVFIRQDATQNWKIAASSVDLVFSRMVLNEIRDIASVFKGTARVLRPRGRAVIAVVHPALSLCDYIEGKKGKKDQHHIQGSGPYFRRAYYSFVITSNKHKAFSVPYFHHTIEDYVSAISKAGMGLKALIEPHISSAVIKKSPQLRQVADRPRSIVFVLEKLTPK